MSGIATSSSAHIIYQISEWKSSKITSIEDSAFEHNTSLKVLELSAVKTIGIRAFYTNETINSLVLPSLISVKTEGFANNTALTSLNFPLLVTVGRAVFFENQTIANLILPKVVSIARGAFGKNNALIRIDFPLVKTIGMNAFYSNTTLTYINIPIVTTLGVDAFQGINLGKWYKADTTFAVTLIIQKALFTDAQIAHAFPN